MKRFLLFILIVITLHIIVVDRYEFFYISPVTTGESNIANANETSSFEMVFFTFDKKYYNDLTYLVAIISIFLGLIGLILFKWDYSPVAAMFIAIPVVLICSCIAAKSPMLQQPIYKSICRTVSEEMDVKIKNIYDSRAFFEKNKLNHNEVVELANKADFYHVTRNVFTPYKKINNKILNDAIREVYEGRDCADMGNFDIATMSWRDNHNEMNLRRESLERETGEKHSTVTFECLAKKVEVKYNTLMKQHNKDVKAAEKLEAKQLKEAAKNNGKKAWDVIDGRLRKLNDALDPIFGEN